MEERFINPYTDYGFKKLFATEQNSDLLISLLNALISNGNDPITSITYKNVEHLGEINSMRASWFDVYCQTQSGADFIVEMQNAKQVYFKDRSLYYATIPIQEQGKKGHAQTEMENKAREMKMSRLRKSVMEWEKKKPRKGWNYRLKDVYLVAIMDFEFPNNEYPAEDYFHEIKLMDVKDKHVFYDKLTLIYLEMPKIKNIEFNLDNMRDKWMYALYSLCYTDIQPPELQDEIFQKLFHEAWIANFNETQYYSYKVSQMHMWDAYNIWECANLEGKERGIEQGIEQGLAKGEEIGIAKGEEIGIAKGEEIGIAKGEEIGLAKGKELGIEEGRKANAIETARKMNALGIDKDTIVQVTGLSLEEIGLE